MDGAAGTPASATTLDGVLRARGARTAVAMVSDLALIGSVVAVAAVAGGPLAAALGGLLAGALLVAATVRTGSSPGRALWGLRVVDQRTGLPPTFPALVSPHVLAADTRQGRDPLRLSPAPLPAITWAPAGDGVGHPAQQLALLADDGATYVVDRPVIAGRMPVDESGNYTPLPLKDMSRSLSRTHAALAPGDGFVLVLDVGSGNGTSIETSDGAMALPPGQFFRAPVGSRVRMGTRHFDVVRT